MAKEVGVEWINNYDCHNRTRHHRGGHTDFSYTCLQMIRH